jgi:hypothetical protein
MPKFSTFAAEAKAAGQRRLGRLYCDLGAPVRRNFFFGGRIFLTDQEKRPWLNAMFDAVIAFLLILGLGIFVAHGIDSFRS